MAKYLVQHRRGTVEQWAKKSTIIPEEGEIVIEIDEVNSLHKLKIGDGKHTYAELAYLKAGDELVTQILAEAKPRIVTVTLTSNWGGTEGKYSQVVTLDNITEHSRLDLQPSADMIAEFKQLGLVFVTENNGSVITVYSVGNKPSKEYTMQATIVEADCSIEDPILGIPVGAGGSVAQSDWNQTSETEADFIKNKPLVYAGSGANSIVLLDGTANGDYSVAGGTADKSVIENLVGSTVAALIKTSAPIAEADMSLAFGTNSKAVSAGSLCIGVSDTVGVTGYYWDSITFGEAEDTITLSSTRRSSKYSDPTYPSSIDWKSGDIISIVNDDRYTACAKIISVSGNTITVSKLPFTTVNYEALPIIGTFTYSLPDDRTIYAVEAKNFDGTDSNTSLLDKLSGDSNYIPRTGPVELGFAAQAIGAMNTSTGILALATGYNNWTAAPFAHAEGSENMSLGYAAHAEGARNKASGAASHAEGADNKATANHAHAEGKNTQAIGYAAHTEGKNTKAIRDSAHAEGTGSQANSLGGHAEGLQSVTGFDTDGITYEDGTKDIDDGSDKGKYAHAEGGATHAKGNYSHTEGNRTRAIGIGAHAEGNRTTAIGDYSHAEGYFNTASGPHAHVEGESNKADSTGSHAEGFNNTVSANFAHAEGVANTVRGLRAHAEGHSNLVTGEDSHVEGYKNNVEAKYSHAEGSENSIIMDNSHAEGWQNKVKAKYAHAEGRKALVLGECGHAQNSMVTVAGVAAHAEGTSSKVATDVISETDIVSSNTEAIISVWNTARNFSLAKGQGSHVQNNNGLAIGKNSSVAGDRNIATGEAQFVVGKYNERNDNALFIVGNGTSATDTKNAFIVSIDTGIQMHFDRDVGLNITRYNYQHTNETPLLSIQDGDDVTQETFDVFQVLSCSHGYLPRIKLGNTILDENQLKKLIKLLDHVEIDEVNDIVSLI